MKSRLKIFISKSIHTLFFACKFICNKLFVSQISNNATGICFVLANGPSLESDLPIITKDEELDGKNCIVMNFFALNEVFFSIKPQHYCLADSLLFINKNKFTNHRAQSFINREKLYTILNKEVDWPLSIYIPNRFYKEFKKNIQLTNDKISIVRVTDLQYKGYSALKFYLYNKRIASPRFQTVANMSIYVGLLKGYSNIKVYGLDHTFIQDLFVNEKSQLCSLDKHFYDHNQKTTPIPLLNIDGTQVKIGPFVEAIGQMFKGHDELELFSKYLNSKITNHTRISLVDSYKRVLN